MGLEAFSLSKKHVVVVGASSGIGAETAVQAASAGASVSICARREDRLKEVVERLDRSQGQTHRMAVLDVAEKDAIDPVFAKFAEEGGPFDGLVYASGYQHLLPLLVLSPKNLEKLLTTNLMGAILAAKAAVKRANKAGGSIVFISSTAPDCPMGGGMTAYSASKGGMNGATTALAYELAAKKIRVNSIAAGCVETEIWDQFEAEAYKHIWDRHPLGVGQSTDIALGCVYLLSPAARWVSGSIITMDGAFLTS